MTNWNIPLSSCKKLEPNIASWSLATDTRYNSQDSYHELWWKNQKSKFSKQIPREKLKYLYEITRGLALDLKTKYLNKRIIEIRFGLKTLYNFNSQIINGEIYSAFQIFKKENTVVVSCRWTHEIIDHAITFQVFEEIGKSGDDIKRDDYIPAKARFFEEEFRVHRGFY